MHGWRKRLGLIVPSSNTTNEPEVREHLPDGVSLHTSRMYLEDVESTQLETMADDAKQCGELLATADVDVIMYGCTTGSLVKGSSYDEQLERELTESTGIPSVATAASIKRAFDELGLERITIVTPYEQELNAREREFLEDDGYDVVSISGLNIRKNTEIGAQRPEIAYRQALDVVAETSRQTDGVFVSCTNYRTFETINQLERDCGMPVVTSNQATLWNALETAGISTAGISLGSLFESS